MLIGAAAALVAAVVLFLIAQAQAGKARDIASLPTSTVSSLLDLASKVATEIGAGSFAEYAELKGKAAPDSLLKADFSGTDCVWYECVATREYEEDYFETDKDGKRERKTRRGSEEVSRILRDPPFYIEDGTGRLKVEPSGAKLEAEKTYSSFEQASGGNRLQVGSFALDLGPFFGSGRRTLGYRLEERCIPVGRELFLLGEASDSKGSLALRKPSEKGKRFIVSVRSEEQILAGARTGATWLRVIAGVAAAAAVGLGIAGLLAV
jgi:hypothetical protein